MTEPRYNKYCSFGRCENWRRSDGIFCRGCYKALPKDMQLSLWEKNPVKLARNIEIAEQWLEDKWNHALPAPIEGP